VAVLIGRNRGNRQVLGLEGGPKLVSISRRVPSPADSRIVISIQWHSTQQLSSYKHNITQKGNLEMAGDHMQVLSVQIYNEQNIVLAPSSSIANAR
jgi:hypothetical protein